MRDQDPFDTPRDPATTLENDTDTTDLDNLDELSDLDDLEDLADPADLDDLEAGDYDRGYGGDYGGSEDVLETEPAREGDDVVYLSDDNDREQDGVHDTPIDEVSDHQARRDDLARQLEELLVDAEEWLGLSPDEDAQDIYTTLQEVYERLGGPIETTDDETQR